MYILNEILTSTSIMINVCTYIFPYVFINVCMKVCMYVCSGIPRNQAFAGRRPRTTRWVNLERLKLGLGLGHIIRFRVGCAELG